MSYRATARVNCQNWCVKTNQAIQDEPSRTYRTTRVTENQFEMLMEMMRKSALLPIGLGRPIALALVDQVRICLMYLRTNITQEFLAEMFFISQPTVSRIISRLTPTLAFLLKKYVPDPEQASKGTTVLIDGTLAPCWSWKDAPELYSGKHKTTGHNLQVVSDLKGRLIHISAPLPGKTHDAEAMRQLDLTTTFTSLAKGNGIGDKGYQGCGIISPKKKPQGGELSDDHKANNKVINRLRAAIERVIANVKTWRILHTDYRRPRETFEDTLDAVRGLVFFQEFMPL